MSFQTIKCELDWIFSELKNGTGYSNYIVTKMALPFCPFSSKSKSKQLD
jgi:hypothetical protein